MNKTYACLLVSSMFIASAGAQLRELSSTREGVGALQFQTRSSNSTVRKVQVSLRRNGRAEIRLLNGVRETFYGDWRNEGGRSCRILLDSVGRDPATGDGLVEHNGRGDFTKVTFSGSVGSTKFDFRFNVPDFGHGNGGDDDIRPGEEIFVRHARRAIQDKFPRNTRIQWHESDLGRVIFGNRQLKGEFSIGGWGGGRYRYTVLMGAGTASVKSVNYSRM